MILSDIKRYLQDRKQATLSDLSLHFDIVARHARHAGTMGAQGQGIEIGIACKLRKRVFFLRLRRRYGDLSMAS